VPAAEYVAEGLLEEPADKATRDSYAERGFVHVPSTGAPGGILADGGVRRDATLALAALRLLHAGKYEQKTLKLRRYVLGLALTAFTHNPSGYLRQGCLLVLDPERLSEFVEVHPTGERRPATITHEDALTYAQEAARAFGVGEDRTIQFEKDRARKDVAGEAKAEGKKAKKGAEEGAK
jgi:CRISPR-associated protein Csb1